MITIEDSLAKLTNKLNHIVIDAYAPETTRWYRKYTECADWYWICIMDPRTKLV